ncbi:hypothetical protein EDD86DRAFT_198055 [Gorgonomyces haynaldii]|nr:hypothetical protein EDD86DRAFT_198055 [Gorgonomyces haynaldii]
MRLHLFNKRQPYFNTTIAQQLEYDAKRERSPHALDTSIPIILQEFVSYFSNDETLSTEGLFRTTASTKQVKQLKEDIEKTGVIKFEIKEGELVVVVASLMKLWLRDLTDGLVPSIYYNDFANASNQPHLLAAAVRSMTPVNFITLRFLCGFLIRLSEFQERNKMTIQNIAIVFGPTVFKCPSEESASGNYMMESMKTKDFMESLLVHHEIVFHQTEILPVSHPLTGLPYVLPKNASAESLSDVQPPKIPVQQNEIDLLVKSSVSSFLNPRTGRKAKHLSMGAVTMPSSVIQELNVKIHTPKETEKLISGKSPVSQLYSSPVSEQPPSIAEPSPARQRKHKSMDVSQHRVILEAPNRPAPKPPSDPPLGPRTDLPNSPASLKLASSPQPVVESKIVAAVAATESKIAAVGSIETKSPTAGTTESKSPTVDSQATSTVVESTAEQSSKVQLPVEKQTNVSTVPFKASQSLVPSPIEKQSPKLHTPQGKPLEPSPVRKSLEQLSVPQKKIQVEEMDGSIPMTVVSLVEESDVPSLSQKRQSPVKPPEGIAVSRKPPKEPPVSIDTKPPDFKPPDVRQDKIQAPERVERNAPIVTAISPARARSVETFGKQSNESVASPKQPDEENKPQTESNKRENKSSLPLIPIQHSISQQSLEKPTVELPVLEAQRRHSGVTPVTSITPDFADLKTPLSSSARDLRREKKKQQTIQPTREQVQQTKEQFKSVSGRIQDAKSKGLPESEYQQDLAMYKQLKTTIKEWQQQSFHDHSKILANQIKQSLNKLEIRRRELLVPSDIKQMTADQLEKERQAVKAELVVLKKLADDRSIEIPGEEEKQAIKNLYKYYTQLKEQQSAEDPTKSKRHLLAEKKRLQVVLHQYQTQFLSKNGRPVKTSQDWGDLKSDYLRYKDLKRQLD